MLILASASAARARLLSQAGVEFCAERAAVDEDALKRSSRACERNAASSALLLAERKAESVSARHPGALVIGADQILDDGERWFGKPKDLDDARAQLRALRGRRHELPTAVACVVDGHRLFEATSVPRLTMRAFSDAFLDAYLEAEGAALLGSVGGYRLEGRGVQLFARVEGDFFAILGLPLIELLSFLRERGIIG
jgi:septum formation protein